MIRRLFSILSVSLFALMMGLLVRDHIWPMMAEGRAISVNTAHIADVWQGKDEWMTLSVNDMPIGVIRNVVQRNTKGYDAFIKIIIQAPFLKGEVNTSATMNERLELEQVRMTIERRGTEQPALELAGRVVDEKLFLRLQSATGTRFQQLRLREPLTLNIAADPFMSRDNMIAGETYSMDVYDPLWGMNAGKLRFTMRGHDTLYYGEESIATTVIEARMDNVLMTVWLDPKDEPIRREIRFTTQAAEDDEKLDQQQFMIRLDRIANPENLGLYHELRELPEVPEYKIAGLMGESTGQPLEALGLFTMLLQGQMQSAVMPKQDNIDAPN